MQFGFGRGQVVFVKFNFTLKARFAALEHTTNEHRNWRKCLEKYMSLARTVYKATTTTTSYMFSATASQYAELLTCREYRDFSKWVQKLKDNKHVHKLMQWRWTSLWHILQLRPEKRSRWLASQSSDINSTCKVHEPRAKRLHKNQSYIDLSI